MKTPIVRSTLWVFLLLFVQLSLNAQTTTPSLNTPTPQQKKAKKPKVKVKPQYAVDFDAGVAMPGNKDLSDIYTLGANASLGFKVGLLKKNKLWIRPMGGLQFYTKEVDLGDGVNEVLRNWKAGLEIQYRALDVKKFSFYPVIRANYNWVSNQFSKATDVEENNSRLLQVSDKFLTGNGISYNAGIMIARSNELYIKIDYQYFKPDLKVDPNVVKELFNQGYIIPDHKVYDFSTLNVSIGYTLNFKK
jgi:hypothetical protein